MNARPSAEELLAELGRLQPRVAFEAAPLKNAVAAHAGPWAAAEAVARWRELARALPDDRQPLLVHSGADPRLERWLGIDSEEFAARREDLPLDEVMREAWRARREWEVEFEVEPEESVDAVLADLRGRPDAMASLRATAQEAELYGDHRLVVLPVPYRELPAFLGTAVEVSHVRVWHLHTLWGGWRARHGARLMALSRHTLHFHAERPPDALEPLLELFGQMCVWATSIDDVIGLERMAGQLTTHVWAAAHDS